MSHRKYEAPRHGNLAFLPKGRCKKTKGTIRSFPQDDATMPPHLTAFMGWKAGMTHIVREVHRAGCLTSKKDVVEAATVVETPEMVCIGLVGYKEDVQGLRQITCAFSNYQSESVMRSYYKNYYKAKGTAFSRYSKTENYETNFQSALDRLRQHATVIRAICHTQPEKTGLRIRKAKLMEIQVNGGSSVDEKIDFVLSLMEKPISVDSVFADKSHIDVIGITKGHGVRGVVTRWGVSRLPRKSHRGNRKVACIGPWHPANIRYSVPRHGQDGYHHRTEYNKRIYKIGSKDDETSGATHYDATPKTINPMGGFPHYGIVKNDFLLLKGCIVGTKKRLVTLRTAMRPSTSRAANEDIELKFIDTSSKIGHGRFQTSEEKAAFYS